MNINKDRSVGGRQMFPATHMLVHHVQFTIETEETEAGLTRLA